MAGEIKKAAVLGSGVMGMAIAGHLAGCGLDVLMLDIVPFDNMLSESEKKRKDTDPSVRNKLGNQSLKAALKWKPPASALFSKKIVDRITIGNFDDDFEKIADCDWIIEVVVERLDIKKQVLANVDKYRNPDSIVSTNTSGLSIVKMSEDCSDSLKKHFMGTHFFNPVRFMKLLEIVPHPLCDPGLSGFMAEFCSERLGKGVIWGKDTPNFVANRIGVHGMMCTMRLMQDMDMRIDEVDAIAGKPMGRPKTASFKTADLVGLDTLVHVADTIVENCPDDEARDVVAPPEMLKKLVEKGALGNKTRAGFYKRGPNKERLVLDWKTMEYVPVQKFEYESVAAAMKAKSDPAKQIKTLVEGDDKAASFAWKMVSESLVYSANRVPEIADMVIEVDNGMKWGFNFKLGPFETWDALGLEYVVERLEKEGRPVPVAVKTMLEKGNKSFYKQEGNKKYQYDIANHKYVEIPGDERVIMLPELGKEKKVAHNDGGTIWDIGDGCACLEFHTKMNAVDNDTIEMQNKLVELLEQGKFEAGIVSNHAENFSVGANIFMILMAINNNQVDEVEKLVNDFQQANMRMKYCKRPIVTAPVGMALGGGCEMTMHGQKVVGAAETYIGLVEVGVGVIPAGGGCKELAVRMTEGLPDGAQVPLLSVYKVAFENIATAKVGMGFIEGQELGYLRKTDIMVPNKDHVMKRAKEVALGMAAAGFEPGRPRNDIPAAGESAKAAFMIAVDGMKNSGWATEYDQFIATKLAHVITGGTRYEGQLISEQELLDLEREAFMSLLGEEKTKERIQYMLLNNKPLRN
ncbi:MAG: 3-hydroxyacyl-CoA dehydrogenase [Deltaproteobacteria bacterium]|nr:3-hydroxyacyl-CoA dehydrogenase [Deltaproteobacteria bacterium]